jgi:hypothetical protein
MVAMAALDAIGCVQHVGTTLIRPVECSQRAMTEQSQSLARFGGVPSVARLHILASNTYESYQWP